MGAVFAYLGRFAIIILGYAAASLAASAFLHIVSLGPLGFSVEEAPWIVMGSVFFSIPFVALFVAYFGFIPAVATILLAEFIGARDWLFHSLAGAFTAIVVIGVGWQAADPGSAFLAEPLTAMSLVGAGLVGGMVYWAIAGRMAGSWNRPGLPDSISPAP